MLITYADSLGENLKDLKEVLDEYYSDAIGGVHILPFFPSSGDRGFAPMRYDVVDEAFGNMEDVKEISKDNYLMYDFMVNHISRQSEFFKDFAFDCRGDDGIDAKRSRPSLGKTRLLCHARKERVLLFGTRSADYIRASSHNGCIQRPNTWLHPNASLKCSIFPLHRTSAVHTWH